MHTPLIKPPLRNRHMKKNHIVILISIFFISLRAMGVETTVNYVWTPANNVSLPKIEFINGVGSRTGSVNFPASSGNEHFHHKLYDCSVSDWSGLWNKETYTYLSVPKSIPTPIGDIKINTSFSDSTYQWVEDERDVSYWKVSSEINKTLSSGSCAIYNKVGVMDYKFGSAKIEVTVPTLPWSGELNVNIPIYAANMEHWWNTTKGGNSNWEYGYGQFKRLLDVPWSIPVTIKAYTNCKLSTYSLNIDYGSIELNKALSGVEKSESINITCSYPSNLNLTLMNSVFNNSNMIPCGSGQCTLTINGSKSITMKNITSTVISVKSLFKTSLIKEGAFSASAILRVDVI